MIKIYCLKKKKSKQERVGFVEVVKKLREWTVTRKSLGLPAGVGDHTKKLYDGRGED